MEQINSYYSIMLTDQISIVPRILVLNVLVILDHNVKLKSTCINKDSLIQSKVLDVPLRLGVGRWGGFSCITSKTYKTIRYFL